jgi:anaerobic selenocysteine-containing dehydrogenase
MSSGTQKKEEPALKGAPLSSGSERWVPSICRLCPANCGIRVRLIDGIPVKIEGNPLHPVSRGGLCPTGQAGLHLVFSPDRVRTPLKRVGERGAHQWKNISWEEALDTVVDTLKKLRSSGSSHKAVLLDGGSQGFLKEIIQRFMTVYGSPNHIDMANSRAATLPMLLMEGQSEPPMFDLGNAACVLSFGFDFLEAEGAPVWQYRMYPHFREGKNGRRGKLFVVDPRFSVTAAKADKWVPVKPGTEGALALGVAYVLIQEELYDKAFIERHTFGFEDWNDRSGEQHLGFRTLVLRDYYPEAVSRITGVPIEDIFSMARSFGTSQPSVAICGRGASSHTNGFYTQLAVHSLNGLVGSIERTGGVCRAETPPITTLPHEHLDIAGKTGLEQSRIDEVGQVVPELAKQARYPFAFNVPSVVAQNVVNGSPYDVQLLFLYKANPIHDMPSQDRWKRCFEKIPLIVSITSFYNESAEYSDLILPEHTYLESWDGVWSTPNVRFSHYGLQRPVMEPVYDTKSAADIIFALAVKLGSPLSSVFPFDNYFSVIKHGAEELYRSGRGAINTGAFEEGMMEYLKERGWRYPGFGSFEEFWKSLVQNGGWFDAPNLLQPLQQAFRTPSEKFEFFPQLMKQLLERKWGDSRKTGVATVPKGLETILGELKINARGDEVFLPHYEEPEFGGNQAVFPLHLKPFRLNTLMDGGAVNTPAMMEMAGFRYQERWSTWVEMNPTTAAKLGIADGEMVWIESSAGKVRTKARLNLGTMPEVVNVPIGMGRKTGRFAKHHGVNPLELVVLKVDPLTGVEAISSTRVKVYKG